MVGFVIGIFVATVMIFVLIGLVKAGIGIGWALGYRFRVGTIAR